MLLASFNYYPPADQFLIGGLVLNVVLLLALVLSRRFLVGLFGGAIVAAVISWSVFGMGKGDMRGVVQLFYTIIFASISGILGGCLAWLLKLLTRQRQNG